MARNTSPDNALALVKWEVPALVAQDPTKFSIANLSGEIIEALIIGIMNANKESPRYPDEDEFLPTLQNLLESHVQFLAVALGQGFMWEVFAHRSIRALDTAVQRATDSYVTKKLLLNNFKVRTMTAKKILLETSLDNARELRAKTYCTDTPSDHGTISKQALSDEAKAWEKYKTICEHVEQLEQEYETTSDSIHKVMAESVHLGDLGARLAAMISAADEARLRFFLPFA